MRHRRAGRYLAMALALAGTAAAADPSDLCQSAAEAAAHGSGVPAALVRTVMTAESGRPGGKGRALRPWPWALNVDGQGYWPETRDQALSMIDGFLAEGRSSIDIGCFQINLRWHGKAFASPEDMIDPVRNASYAVGFLQDLMNETGSWRAAAGAYHSRDPDRAESYVQRLKAVHATLSGAPPVPPSPTALPSPQAPDPAPQSAVRAAFSLVKPAGALIDTSAARRPLIRPARGDAP